ncbi:MAG: S-adenosylmethionine:tRNA ribosyltransferase-isomerase [Bacteroidota bacterium]
MPEIPTVAIDLTQYHYDLPESRIAKYPLEERDTSKLLIYRNGEVEQEVFRDLSQQIESGTTLVFNNTKVIPARLYFEKDTGARIEIFLLHPLSPSPLVPLAMEAIGHATWDCMIGNKKRWKQGQILTRKLKVNGQNVNLKAAYGEADNQVSLDWDRNDIRFVDIVEAAGQVPLPPYLNREANEDDKPRYQTVYSKKEGAVAAPTAGLHFTPQVLESLKAKGIHEEFLTLHVSAGTFQPIKVDDVTLHPMHSEQVVIAKANLQNLLKAKAIIPVGTTSMRTLESLYWYGVKLHEADDDTFSVSKLAPYQEYESLPSRNQSFEAVIRHMDGLGQDEMIGETEIFIFPGYDFKVCDGLVTNFHQPGSTLILLIAAFIGEDWKKVYDYALANDFRFLSYGDSSLLMPAYSRK